MATRVQISHTPGRIRRRFVLASMALVTLLAAVLGGVVSPASAQTPILVTNPDGSVSYLTPQNGSLAPRGERGAPEETVVGSRAGSRCGASASPANMATLVLAQVV
jgi:hypothetical protein